MPLRYYSTAPPSSASQTFKNDAYALYNSQFNLATDWFQIERESSFGSGSYVSIDVRLTSLIDQKTGTKMGDDWRQIIFSPADNFTDGIGWKYRFNNNVWVSVFSDVLKSLVVNCATRRCNAMLRWIDDNGVIYEEECAIDYNLIGTRNLERGDNLVLPEGYVLVYAQLNDKTKKIKPNQRFLFGPPEQRTCMRIHGGGLQNMLNQQTSDDTSGQLLVMTMENYQVDETTDNLTLGIADYYRSVYSVSLSASQISGNIGESYPINATLLLNSIPTSGSLTYTSSASDIATIDTSGSITMIASGSTIAYAYMGGNADISASALVAVSASSAPINTEEIRVTPSDNVSILEEDTTTFTSYLYLNGVQQADVFTYAPANTNVPTNHYTLTTISQNSFSVKNNEMYLESPLLINATSGSYTKQISISLNGAW